jgi:hypothetical protein
LFFDITDVIGVDSCVFFNLYDKSRPEQKNENTEFPMYSFYHMCLLKLSLLLLGWPVDSGCVLVGSIKPQRFALLRVPPGWNFTLNPQGRKLGVRGSQERARTQMSRPKRQCAQREQGFYADIQGADLGSAGLDFLRRVVRHTSHTSHAPRALR